ncbi:MAG: M23 family metallopeptidase [Treponema sp.]|nr:M23 family metallopeptidase [Treponema sp.]
MIVKRGSSNNRHTGVDLGSWQKSVPIKSFISGKVLECTWNKTKKEKASEGFGNMMLIEGSNGYLYLLAHLTSFLKKKGDPILPGDDVAMSGQTGYSDGYHLHLEIIRPIDKAKAKIEGLQSMYIIDNSNQFIGWKNEAQRLNRFNPFDHDDKFNSFN